MSFTRGALFKRESLIVADEYLVRNTWEGVKDNIIDQNKFQSRAYSSLKTITKVIVSRLQELNDAELSYLAMTTTQEQSYLLWIAICRHYRFLHEFAVEVLRERYLTLHTTLNHEDYDSFFNRKADWHTEIDQLTESTQKKLKQVAFLMLRETGLLTGDYTIMSPFLTPEFVQLLIEHSNQTDLAIFPISDQNLAS
ncbi:MAG: DUF1819 family protein [Akkermansiaceae bacterium]